jgi:GntR family transcriptional regulator/MocR family aminotransferase
MALRIHATLAYQKNQSVEFLVGQFSSSCSLQANPRGARGIYDALKGQIEDRVYEPGQPLPSTRALAEEFGCSRTTVTTAYDQLLAEGFIETHQGRRACVASDFRADRSARVLDKRPAKAGKLSAFAERLAGLAQPPVATEPVQTDFRYGDIAAADFPHLAWRRCLAKALAMSGSRRLRYHEPQGSIELRAALQAYLWRARSLRCEVDQIIIVNGTQQALDLCSRLLLDVGDRFVIESPCYWAALHVFKGAGAMPHHVPVDKEGLLTNVLGKIRNARLCYVTPSHQYPLGHVLSASRRDQLLRWAAAAGAYIIEDDYDSEYRYDIRPVPPLQAIDTSNRVIYLGTTSKTLSPLLRIGYVVVPPALIDVFRTAKLLTDRHSPTAEQLALADFIQSGAYERHVRKIRRKNAQRRAALLNALSQQFGNEVEVQGSEAGLHVVAWFNSFSAASEDAIAKLARRAGVGIYPISGLYPEGGPANSKRKAGFIFGYAAVEERDIRSGIARLAGALTSK